MGKLFDRLSQDYRVKEGLKACINCGVCVAICPAAEFYKYSPKTIVNIVQSRDDEQIEALLKSETIWYCGECMSCMTRCPRGNVAGMLIMALRGLSIELGYFAESEKGRQQIILQRLLCGNVLNYGYCIYPRTIDPAGHPEAGPVFKWVLDNADQVYARVGANLDGEGPGVLRKVPQESLDELKAIFDVTGATARMEAVEEASRRKAEEMGLTMEQYCEKIYNETSDKHFNC